MKLLNVDNNAKTKKGRKLNVVTGILYLAPYDLSGFNVCPFSSPACRKACLYTAGRGCMSNVQAGRLRKTLMFFKERPRFWFELINDIKAVERKAKREGKQAAIRLNGTSDLPWHNIKVPYKGRMFPNIMSMFPNVVFYDYTARPLCVNSLPENYHITFSEKENNENAVDFMLEQGVNVAVVFKGKLPKWYKGRKVRNGDLHDCRFLDSCSGGIIGLVAKGKARKQESGFVKKGA